MSYERLVLSLGLWLYLYSSEHLLTYLNASHILLLVVFECTLRGTCANEGYIRLQ